MPPSPPHQTRPWAIFLIFLRLGLTSFGGPVAHLGYFRAEFVTRRRWLSERSYADLMALCQFLPGPASSQVGIALGLSQAGYRGALAAWLGFTLPSALALIVLALGLEYVGDGLPSGALHGLKVAAVAVVAQAVWGMGRSLCPDTLRVSLMALVACLVLSVPGPWMPLGALVLSAVLGARLCKPPSAGPVEPLPIAISPRAGCIWLLIFAALLIGLPILARLFPVPPLVLADAFFRAGSMIFGGGHVMLPLLDVEVVQTGWVSPSTFLAGYGATQMMPGPLTTFAGFLGASIFGWWGGVLGLLAIFAPAFLLVFGALPFWERLRTNRRMQAAMLGINAGVVGLLLAALYRPLWTGAIARPEDFALGLLALVALMFWKLPPWLVVMSAALIGAVWS